MMVTSGEVNGGMVKQALEIKEYTSDAHQVLYVSVESLSCTPETNIILYVDQTEFKQNLRKRDKDSEWK